MGALRPNCSRTAHTWSRWRAAASPVVSAMPCGVGEQRRHTGSRDQAWPLAGAVAAEPQERRGLI